MNNAVTYSLDRDVAVLTIENPPVNALSHAVLCGIMEALDRAAADPAVRAVVLMGRGRNFSAGADINEFGDLKEPSDSTVNARCELFAKPVVAAIGGWALGGGLELALSCHARLASSDARLGLPEVKLGIIPGAGGTQRLPRIIGPEAALDVIVSGDPISAAQAASIGIIDRLVEGNLLDNAKAFAREFADSDTKPVPVRDREKKLAAARSDPSGFDAYAGQLMKRARGLDALLASVEAVRMALDTPFEVALKREQALCRELVNGPQSKAQRHLFFAERKAAKVVGVGKDTKVRDIGKAAIIGAGTMGRGIAISFANAGMPVTILELNQETLERSLAAIRDDYELSVKRGSLDEAARDERMDRLTGTTRYDDLAEADLIIEAAFEDMSVKKQVFAIVDKIAKPGAIIASSTSFLDIDEIAAVTHRSSDVLGMHFFSPANVTRVLEIVRGGKTAPDALAAAISLSKRISKVAVLVGVCRGFVGNRMHAAQSTELEHLLLEGAEPEQVDEVFTDFGFPMGPCALADFVGNDVAWRNRKSLGLPAAIADALCEAGRFGQKTGKGFYLYEAGSRTPVPDPWVTSLISEKGREVDMKRRDVPVGEIIERTIYPMINEGARILDEGIVARPSDIDLIWVHGYGFPIGKGGPMFWADQEGLAKLVERLEYWCGRTGNPVFEPAPLLRKLAASGGSFANL